MRAVVAATVIALMAAAPAAAVSGGLTIAKLGRPIQLTTVGAGKDKTKSCQAGKNGQTKAALLGSRRRFAVLACEQAPRINLASPSAVAKATAAALSVLG